MQDVKPPRYIMSYKTTFVGTFPFSRPLTEEELSLFPKAGPSAHCGWTATPTELCWDGKPFDSYLEWLEDIVDTLQSWGVHISGAVQWQGEDAEDRGVISVRKNRIQVHYEEYETDAESDVDAEDE